MILFNGGARVSIKGPGVGPWLRDHTSPASISPEFGSLLLRRWEVYGWGGGAAAEFEFDDPEEKHEDLKLLLVNNVVQAIRELPDSLSLLHKAEFLIEVYQNSGGLV